MARLIVEQPGVAVTVQDGGRPGYRKFGVPPSGALDQGWRIAANALAGAPDESAALEILLAAPVFRVEAGPLRIGLAGALSGLLTRADGGEHRIASWSGVTLHTGDRVALRLARAPAYVAFSGGLDVPLVLGARATDLRAGFGGLQGRALAAGDALSCGEAEGGDFSARPLSPAAGPLRFIPGPQADRFPHETFELFIAADWQVGAQSDRMGLRLSGPRLAHDARGANIVSDGVTSGAIQVPGDGQPILLRADGQTSGGYAKIGCVITADLDRIAHALPGETLRFQAVDHDEAARARGESRATLASWRQSLARQPVGVDEGRLWSENLIDGAIFAE
jgi:biotin-dependent carboxylase-like uncharacterized protein